MALTGSRTIERFTGPQIRKFAKDDPAGWERTTEVHLVSSFIASLLVGEARADRLRRRRRDEPAGARRPAPGTPTLLEATAPGPRPRSWRRRWPARRRSARSPTTSSKKYGFTAGTPVVAFTGDNPSSLVGMGATRPGTAVISLGTSDTMFAAMGAPRTDPRGFGNVFGNPAGGFMALGCFANGSLAREEVAKQLRPRVGRLRPRHPRADAPGNRGNVLLPYFVPEITPRLLQPAPALVRRARLRRRTRTPPRPPAPSSRRRRCRCASTPPGSARRPTASW